jgi:hypothetical protein
MRYCLDIELEGITPAIWRRVWVEGQMSLRQLHHIVQAAMGWTTSHLHWFDIDGRHYGAPDPDGFGPKLIDDRSLRLEEILVSGLRFEYLYDFGDSWTHLVHVAAAQPIDEPFGAASVEAGARACPTEDCGGAPMYQAFLDRRAAQPRHAEVKEFLEWAGEDFDPDRFDRRAANAALLRMAWNRWGEERVLVRQVAKRSDRTRR